MNRIRLVVLAAVSLIGCTPAERAERPEPAAPTLPAQHSASEASANDVHSANALTTQQGAASPSADSAQAILARYGQMRRMADRMPVDPWLATMCRSIQKSDIARSARTYGPHAAAYVNIYMNDAAATAFAQDRQPYPVGAVVVKEKTASRDGLANGVGGMVKRAAGYDPEHGDWEYFYVESPRPLETGRIDSCVQCHAGAAGSDYVFGQWAADAKRFKR